MTTSQIFQSSLFEGYKNRKIMAKYAARENISTQDNIKFLAGIFFYILLFLLIIFPPKKKNSNDIHIIWADKINSKYVSRNEVDMRNIFSMRAHIGFNNFVSNLRYLIHFIYIGFIKCNTQTIFYNIYTAFELFAVLLLIDAKKVVSSASALDRRSIFLSKLCVKKEIEHNVYQHGVINSYKGVHIPQCDNFYCCFKHSLNHINKIYKAKNVEFIDGWCYPGWLFGKEVIDIFVPLSPIEFNKNIEILGNISSKNGKKVHVKLHPRDKNITNYKNLKNITVIDYLPLQAKIVVGSLSTVIAEAYYQGLDVQIYKSESEGITNCLQELNI